MESQKIDYHFIGVGGIGMSALAKILIARGYKVSGSDLVENQIVKTLRTQGIVFYLGQKKENINKDIKTVVFSGAINDHNAELVEAHKLGITVITRSQLLGQLMSQKKGIAIAGTHGKTTTSTMVSLIFESEGLDPTVAIGGEVRNIGGNAKDGQGEYFIAEACEYKRYFLDLKPDIAVITNIEADHLDYYKDLAEIESAFTDFAGNLRENGLLIAGVDSPSVCKVLTDSNKKVITYGINTLEADYRAVNIRTDEQSQKFEIARRGKNLGQFSLQAPGLHNIQNALAAIAVSLECDLKLRTIKEVLTNFTGAARRMEYKGKTGEVSVFDDYAHHPSEIKASLAGLKDFYPKRKIWCVFQPHQYSRTKFLLKDFAKSFANADAIIITEIYAVRDTAEDLKAISGQNLAEQIEASGKECYFISKFTDCAHFLKKKVHGNDIIITMGAGPVNTVADIYLQDQDNKPTA